MNQENGFSIKDESSVFAVKYICAMTCGDSSSPKTSAQDGLNPMNQSASTGGSCESEREKSRIGQAGSLPHVTPTQSSSADCPDLGVRSA
jgi:hypothetical protein